jgi:glycosyltransferase involved in cell wall biosynthesis
LPGRRQNRWRAWPVPPATGLGESGSDRSAGAAEPRVKAGEAARDEVRASREAARERGRAGYAGRRLLFVLPADGPSGGAKVIVQESRALAAMDVHVELFNLAENEPGFKAGFPGLDLPLRFGRRSDVAALAANFDAVVATLHSSVAWLPRPAPPGTVLGHYVQDFEPYFYAPGTGEFDAAWAALEPRPGLVRITKTEWNRHELSTKTGAEAVVVGPSVDIDLYRPRPRSGPSWPDRPVSLAALVRPDSPHRQPELTMAVLRDVAARAGSAVEIVVFGVAPGDPGFDELSPAAGFHLAGRVDSRQMAWLLNEVDVFADLSRYQAMGLTALEAMACGVSAAVPERGGTADIGAGRAALSVNTASPQAAAEALMTLVEDSQLRERLALAGIREAVQHYPEAAAVRMLEALFR